MPYDASSCDCSYGLIRVKPAQCRLGCGGEGPSYGWNGTLKTITQKRIWHTVGVPESLYLSELSAFAIVGGSDNRPAYPPGVNWNQSSDRARAHSQIATVPSHGNSTKTTSPNSSCARLLMPTATISLSSVSTHSCVLEYLTSSPHFEALITMSPLIDLMLSSSDGTTLLLIITLIPTFSA